MSRFTILIQPDGKALLSTKEVLGAEEARQLIQQVRDWQNHQHTVGVIVDCDVVFVQEIDLELREMGAIVGAAG